jgi:hypothetical protein
MSSINGLVTNLSDVSTSVEPILRHMKFSCKGFLAKLVPGSREIRRDPEGASPGANGTVGEVGGFITRYQ